MWRSNPATTDYIVHTNVTCCSCYLCHFKGSKECITLGKSNTFILLAFGVGNLADVYMCCQTIES